VSFPAYPKYKDSRVDWVGPIPEHWEVCALGFRYEVALGKMLDEKRITGRHLAPYLRNTDVQWDKINSDDLPEMDFSGDDLTRYQLKKGDLLVCEGGEVGRCAIWDASIDECYYQKALHRVRALSPADSPLYLRFVLFMAASVGVFAGSAGKSTIAHLPAETFRRHRFPFPPRDEQVRIAAFLDCETAKIDALVAEQWRLIELLKEKRQATITHAVTKGLDPHVPMKDSGIEWLGELPAHWTLTRMKHLVSVVEQGWSPQCENGPAEEGAWGVLKVGCVNGGAFNPSENKALPTEFDPVPALAVRKNDLLISRANTRELVGSAAVVERDYPKLMLCDKLYRIRMHEHVEPIFMAYYLGSGAVRGQIELDATGASASMLNISQASILELAVPLPSRAEQIQISAFVRTELNRIADLTSEAERSIDLLVERRNALISAAVTGQIDVRHLAEKQAAA